LKFIFLKVLLPENPIDSLEITSLSSSERKLPRCPSKEGDNNKERYNGVSGKTITGTPEEVELEDEEHNDGDSNVETSTVSRLVVDIRTTSSRVSSVVRVDVLSSIELTLTVELVEPDDDKGSNTKEDEVESILSSGIMRSHVSTVHTVDIENTHNGDYNIDEPVIIHKPWDSRRTSSDVLIRVMLGSSEDIEYHSKEDETEDKIGPEHTTAELILEERERTTLFNRFFLGRGISTAYRGGSRVCDHLDS
jgi:hypothetical protein